MSSTTETTSVKALIIDNRSNLRRKYGTSFYETPDDVADDEAVNTKFSSVTLSWENINAFVTSNGNGNLCPSWCTRRKVENIPPKQILVNINGIVKPGTLLAIMGGSGSGKSTLLNVLNQRRLGKLTVTGDVRVNGVKFDKSVAAISGYVQQDDLFINCLKLKEHLWFQAMLRMDQHLSKQSRITRVEEVMIELGLGHCSETFIESLSGGEKKRLAFACEVLTNPALLFCDEPTSGLDSSMAENIVQTLKNLAEKNKTVLFTIHQPSSEVYSLFDRILLLANRQVAYMGPRQEIANFFIGLGKMCPPDFNPADFYVHTLAIVAGKEEICTQEIQKVCDAYGTSVLFANMNSEIKEVRVNGSENSDIETERKPLSPYKSPCCQHFCIVLWRSWIVNVRNPSLTRMKLFQSVVVAMVIGFFFFRQPYDQKGIQNINGALFIQQMHMSLWPFFTAILVFPLEFSILLREHHNGMYSVWAYFLSKVTSELPHWIIFPIIYCSISYWLIGLYANFGTFIIATATLCLSANVAAGFGYVIASCSRTIPVATSIAQVFNLPLMLFGGFFLNTGSIPVYVSWIKYFVWYTYSNEILIINQWQHVTNITCEIQHQLTTGFNSNATEQAEESYRCFVDGVEVIQSLGFNTANMPFDFVMLIVLNVIFRLISFIVLYIRSRQRE